ncbi:MAG: recombinase zinc beta ribbon domain-containing protein [Candidatus Binatia bacterium]|nr:recombinase zinc beta ribbon domain-containing protein [Candidatus Binatia bacterium]
MEPDPASASLIREAFERYAKGTETKADVLREVTALGLRTRKGKPLLMQTFQKTLRKPIYAAVLRMPAWEIDAVPGNFEPIVPEHLFERVQDVLDGKSISVTPHTRNHADFPLRRFARCAHCDTPLTGSWSKGRNRKYAYYRCRTAGCQRVKIGKDAFEGRFLDFLTGLRPKPEYVRLFREIVLDVWNAKRAEAKAGRLRLSRCIEDLEERRQKLVEAYLYRGGIDDTVYRRQDDKLAEEIALVRTELHDEELAEIDVEGVLNFAEVLLLDTRRLWIEGNLAQRQRLQKVLFPAGITFDQENGFGTAETASFFRWLAAVPGSENRKATLAVSSLNQIYGWLRRVSRLRDALAA